MCSLRSWPRVILGAALLLAAGALPRAAAARPAGAAGADSVRVNSYLWYAPAARTVHVALDAAVGGNNGGMNFNGRSGGGATITVPLGWKVRMRFTNQDAIPHSAIVIAGGPPVPAIPQTPAFAGAYTRDLTAGLNTGDGDDLNFKASAAGRYLIVCGVPGHGASGMWIRFDVAAEAGAPDYAM